MTYPVNGLPEKQVEQEKILLALLPFWSPLIPPIGIACLKSYLQEHNYEVKTVDTNMEIEFTHLYDRYFDILRSNIPVDRQGNFFSVGHDVMRNQMMAYLNYTVEADYQDLVNLLVYKSFYVNVPHSVLLELCKIIDDFYKGLKAYILDLLDREKPSVFGLSVFSGTLPASMFAFKITRETHPHIRTIMGGGVFADPLANGTPNFDIFLEETRSYIDKIFIGEGEILFLKWLKDLLPPSKRVYMSQDIGGEIMELGTAKVLDMMDFDCRNYPFIVSYTSRSCPFQCSFCSETVQWGKYRKKSARMVYEELLELYKRHGSQLFLLSDSLLNPVIRELADEFLESGESLYWSGWLKVDKHVCNVDNALNWRRSGFYQARLGIESGAEHVLELMGKQISIEQIRASISNLSAAGIKTTTLWVVGHPGETEEDFQETLALIEELRNDIYEAECRPFYFYLSGQAGTGDDWWGRQKKIPLYPKEAEDMLLLQTWLMDCEPSREVTYRRMNRFVQHCRELGVPNPYSMHDIYQADERWKKLHKNAVPPLVNFKNYGTHIDESRKIEKINLVKGLGSDTQDRKEYVDFGF